MGLRPERVREKADLILYNTCCVRENAENRALGNVIWLKELKKERPELLICVGGCMAQEAGMAERMKAMYPFIDLVFGTHNMHRLPEYLCRVLRSAQPVVEVAAERRRHRRGPAAKARRARSPPSSTSCTAATTSAPTASCPMCAAGSARGSRRRCWRSASALWMQGVQEITLLGQNVNSYRGGGSEFAELLRRVDALGVPRIRFMTSHPKDLERRIDRRLWRA